jgi:multiple sugar transport system substrate-binding protein
VIKRSLLCLSLLFIVVPLFAACGTASSTGPTEMTINCNGKAFKKNAVTITWMSWSNPHMQQAIDDFNCTHTNIQVNSSIYAYTADDSEGKLLASVVAHHTPDLVIGYYDSLASWASRGELQPLDAYTNQPGLQAKEYEPYAWQSSQWLNHTYGIPVDWDPDTLLYYNKQIFKQHGISGPPKTLDELIDDANKIDSVKNGHIQQIGFAPWAGWEFNQVEFGHLFGASLDDGSAKEVKINTPQMQKSLQWELNIAKKFGGASNVNNFTDNNTSGASSSGLSTDPLISGRIAMEVIGTWEIDQRDVIGKKAFDDLIGIAPMPSGAASYICHSGYAFMVPTGAQHIPQVMQFVQWLEQQQNFVKYFSSQSWVPANIANRQADFYQKDPVWSTILKSDAQAGTPKPWLWPSPILTQYYKAVENAEAEVINLQASPENALAQADSEMQQFLKGAINDGAYSS